MTSVSTHVLDTSSGSPAVGVAVRLESPGGDVLAADVTGADGRVPAMTSGLAGEHRLVLDTGSYFAAHGQPVFYPSVTIAFVPSTEHSHVPVLLSPFGFSTYRGA